MKEKIKNIKFSKKMIIIAATILIVALVVALILIFGGNKKSQQLSLTDELKELGVDFYENFYYDQISKDDKERNEFLEKYKDIGIKISLDNLSRYKVDETEKIVKKFINNESKKECDRINSMVVIYPKEPYKKDSYTIDALLECGFKTTKK